MTKQFRQQIRTDLLTDQLIFMLLDKMSTDDKKMSKSDLFRSAIYRMAKDELPAEDFAAAVQSSFEIDNI